MTAFTVCWLPFFILALLRPFSYLVDVSIPDWVFSICQWLGYANSMLNPIIYVTFHQDFRRAFRYLLCLQCATLDTRMREEAYQNQYGRASSINLHHHHAASYSHQATTTKDVESSEWMSRFAQSPPNQYQQTAESPNSRQHHLQTPPEMTSFETKPAEKEVKV